MRARISTPLASLLAASVARDGTLAEVRAMSRWDAEGWDAIWRAE